MDIIKDMIHGLDKFKPYKAREMCTQALIVFLSNHAEGKNWNKPFLEITQVFGAGKTGSAVISVRYGNDFNSESINHVYRVLKIGERESLIEEKNGADVFNNWGSEYFSRLALEDSDFFEDSETKKTFAVLEYDDAKINSSAKSLKNVSEYVIDHYFEAKGRGENVDPNPLGENIGDVLSRMFSNLKEKVYGVVECESSTEIEVIKKGGAEKERKTLSAIFADKIKNAFIPSVYNELDAYSLTGKTYSELLDIVNFTDVFYMANNIHGDMNPGNVLLCVEDNQRDINTARLIDYGEVINKKREGFTFVFWDAARLIGEFILDFAEEVIKRSKTDTPDNAIDNQKIILYAIFTNRNETNELSGIWLFQFHVLAGMIHSLFSGDNKHNRIYQTDKALNGFLTVLQGFLLFYCKFKGEELDKKLFALKLVNILNEIRSETTYARFVERIESFRGEVITRSDSRRVCNNLKEDKFAHLDDISELILSGFKSVQTGIKLPINAEYEEGVKARLYDIIMKIKEEGHRKLLITGEGGMGKTTALFHLFEILSGISGPIPMYLELQRINGVDDGEDELNDNWILNRLIYSYTQGRVAWDTTFTEEDKRGRLKAMFSRVEITPRFVLLLDGYNEVTRHRDKLVKSIQKFEKDFHNVIVVVASRPMSIEQRGLFTDFEELELTGVEENDIRKYLEDKSPDKKNPIPYPEHKGTAEMINNPFFLCLYAGTEAERQMKGADAFITDFFDQPETPGEIIHNFFCATGLKWFRTYRTVPDKIAWQEEELRYYLEIVLPEIAFHMEKAGIFQMDKNEVLEIIRSSLTKTEDDEYLDSNEYEYDFSYIKDEIKKEYKIRDSKFSEYILRDGLGKQLSIFIDDGSGSYRFIHQNFRDYFAAVYYHNRIREFLKDKRTELEEYEERYIAVSEHLYTLRDRVLSLYVKRMLGDIYREHRNNLRYKDDWYDDSHYYDRWPESKTVLDLLLDRLRGITEPKRIGYIIYNVIQIFIEAVKDLSRYDFSYLYLKGISFNGIRLGRRINYPGAKFDGCELTESNFFPMGHEVVITSATYSPDGNFIVSASSDGIIKEWDVNTGQCISMIPIFDNDSKEQSNYLLDSTWYSSDGKLIISKLTGLNRKHTDIIKEWDIYSGQYVKTYAFDREKFDSNICSKNACNQIVISGERIKDINVITSECVRVYSGHSTQITTAVYSPNAQRIISGAIDGTLKEWDTNTGECIRSYKNNNEISLKLWFSNDGKRVFIGSSEKTIKEWDTNTGKCIQIYENSKEFGCREVFFNDGSWGMVSLIDGRLKILNKENIEKLLIERLPGFKIKLLNKKTKNYIYLNAYQLAISPNIHRAVSIGIGNHIKEYDLSSGNCISCYNGKGVAPSDVCYSPDGKFFAVLMEEGLLNIFEVGIPEGEIIIFKIINGLILQGISLLKASLNFSDEQLYYLFTHGAEMSYELMQKAERFKGLVQTNNNGMKEQNEIDFQEAQTISFKLD